MTAHTKNDALLKLLESIHKTCIDKAPKQLTCDNENLQVPFMISMYSIVVELAGDSYQSVKSRKELGAHILTRALLEAVVVLCNVINEPNYVKIHFKKALAKGKKPLKYQLDNPHLINKDKHTVEDIQMLLDKGEELLNPEVAKPYILDDFENAGMKNYYYTRYAFLCNYSHHDASVIMNRPIGMEVSPLDEKSTRILADWIADLILKASIAVHEFLKTDQKRIFQDLQKKWQATFCSKKL
ncbi:MAG: DUF5677 domain-containing protein [Planctomycetota bacterium]|jgi:hypothetical protein